ncbi:MAG: outer membrane beta-barrel domain-containing protein [Caldimonas sp.]
MTSKTVRLLLLAAAAAAISASAHAADPPPPPASEPVVVPEVDRRPIRLPRFPSNDFELGIYGGTYATQNFGTSAVGGVRLGYHITEDFFVEGAYGRTTVTDKAFRLVFPGAGVFAEEKQKLTYYNLSAAYNILPGEVFLGGSRAKPAALYVIAGLGSTKVATQRRPTMNFGFGYRVFLNDHFALQLDLRDHIFSLDLLGVRENTQNIELTGGLAVFF